MKVKISKLITMALIMFGALFTSCSKDDTVKVSSVKLSQTTVSIQLGEKVSLKATVTPSDATDAIVTWSTSSASVATVDNSGNVSAVSIGTATITASAGGMTATCTVTVKPKAVTGVTLSESTLTLKTGDKAELKATVVPSDATDGTVTWTSSAATIAKVDDKGNVTAVAAGTATITAKAGDMTATCTVTVKERDVYISGLVRGGKGTNSVATIWKNGVETSLTDGKTDAIATSVFVSGGDVYAAGTQLVNAYSSIGKVWKNGVATNITDGIHNCNLDQLFVSGNDVYVVGILKNDKSYYDHCVWKNGVKTILPTKSNSMETSNFSLYVSGSDVYVSGGAYDGNDWTPLLWKNNVLTILNNSDKSSRALSVAVYGGDVYVAGSANDNNDIVIWKNGVESQYVKGLSYEVLSLSISNGDLYMAVAYNNKGYMFKNGVMT